MTKNEISNQPKIVLIGGGTGSFTLLSELKKHTKNITALVNMADSGGSSGVLRDELGVLPPGDVRQCLVALSNSEELRDLFNFRFANGTFGGHSFGNLFLSAAEQQSGGFANAVRLSSKILNITGSVVPITLDNCQLVLTNGGKILIGEHEIGQADLSDITHPELSLEPAASLNPEALLALNQAELIVIAPGNLYGSLAPALLVKGLAKALEAASAPVAFVCNLVNKPRQTDDYYVHDYVSELERFTAPDVIDFVLYNNDEPEAELLKRYALEGEYPVNIDKRRLDQGYYQTIAGGFLSRGPIRRDPSDKFIKRSLIRHDAVAACAALLAIL